MIKNDRQYKVTRSQLTRFEHTLDELRLRGAKSADKARRAIEVDAVDAQVAELGQQLREYEALKSGSQSLAPLRSLSELPETLIRARIASGLTQKDLADRLGMKEQQVQRYEANDWATASLARLIEVADALRVEVDRALTSSASEFDYEALVLGARNAGLDPAFVERRLAPPSAGAVAPENHERGAAALELAARLGRVFSWSPSAIVSHAALRLEPSPEFVPSYKLPKRASAPRVRAYTVYSHYLAVVVLQACEALAAQPIPESAESFRTAVLDSKGSLEFGSLVSYIWDLGIPVLPLADPGGFHAALWRIRGRDVIVLKQQPRLASRWAFDLLHEVYHAAATGRELDHMVVDIEIGAGDTLDTAEESANLFAGDVLLDGSAEELAQQCVEEARGSVEGLKTAVPRVAGRSSVNVGDLANYVAFRLALQGVSWWGASVNLQSDGPDPWSIARDELLGRMDWGDLSELDRGLLVQALSDSRE